MIKAEIITKISEKTGITKPAVQMIIESTMEVIKKKVASGENVYLRGFGTFCIKHRALRHFNYAPGKMKLVPEHDEPAFKPCTALKEAVKKTPLK